MDSLRSAQDAGAVEFDGRQVVVGGLFVTCCDVADVLDTVEEFLNEVALPVEPARERKALLAVVT